MCTFACLLLRGITQKLMYKILIIRNIIHKIYMDVSLYEALLCFVLNILKNYTSGDIWPMELFKS